MGAMGMFPVLRLWFSGLTLSPWWEGQPGSWILSVSGESGSQGSWQGHQQWRIRPGFCDLALESQVLADINPGGFLE